MVILKVIIAAGTIGMGYAQFGGGGENKRSGIACASQSTWHRCDMNRHNIQM